MERLYRNMHPTITIYLSLSFALLCIINVLFWVVVLHNRSYLGTSNYFKHQAGKGTGQSKQTMSYTILHEHQSQEGVFCYSGLDPTPSPPPTTPPPPPKKKLHPHTPIPKLAHLANSEWIRIYIICALSSLKNSPKFDASSCLTATPHSTPFVCAWGGGGYGGGGGAEKH